MVRIGYGLHYRWWRPRFRRHVAVIDSVDSRARLIPKSHNYPGFAEGVTGPRLLEFLRRQAEHYGVLGDTSNVWTRIIVISPCNGPVANCWLRASSWRRVLSTNVRQFLGLPKRSPLVSCGIAQSAMALKLPINGSRCWATRKMPVLSTFPT